MAVLPADFAARVITTGMCSCDLYTRPGSAEDAGSEVHIRRKFEKRGWTEAKITRALAQSKSKAAKAKQPVSGLRSDVSERIERLCREAGSVALLVHFYNGDVETERLPVGPARFCDCADLAAQGRELAEDQLLIAATTGPRPTRRLKKAPI